MTKNSNKQLGKDYFISFKKSLPFSHYIKSSLLPLFLLGGFPHVTAAPVSKPVPDVLRTLTVTGVVKDTNNQPVIGASIVESGTTHGTITNVNGEYTLKVSSHSSLRISSIGYETKTIKVGDNNKLNVILSDSHQNLSELVVVGYGVQKKSDLTGAVSSVSISDLQSNTAASVGNLLGGTIPGVQVTATSGQPGGNFSIRVRGGSSVQGGNEPLYVIDGFPVYEESITAGAVSGATSNPLSYLNPNDIESVNILKDASATAIYGSRGANGVVIITTKKGTAGRKASVTYQGNVGFQSLRKKIDVLDAHDFAILRNDALYDTYPEKGKYQYLNAQEIASLGKGTNWQDEAFQTAFMHSHQLTIAGGSERTHYVISGNYFAQDGIITNTDFKRFSSRINLDSRISERITVGINVTGTRTTSRLAPNGIVTALLLMPPTATVYDKDGKYTLRNPFENIFSNPIASLHEQLNKTRSYKVLSTAFGEYAITKGLKVKVLLGTTINNTKEYSYIPSTIYEGVAKGGIASLGTVDVNSWVNENTLTYNVDFSEGHHLDALLGFTQQETNEELVRTGSSGFVSDDLAYNNLQGGSVTTTPYSYAAKNAMLSYLGRVNYNYAGKYYLTLSFRRDGSSRFGRDNKWGTFPSAGFSWHISRENFFNSLSSLFSNLKLRLSYGKTGNQEIGNYQALATLTATNYIFGDKQAVGYKADRIANSRLGWETTHQFDAGIDIGLFNERLTLTLDAYWKKTNDLLLNVEIPWTSGFSSSLQNYGSISNKGLEVALHSKNFIKDFQWTTDFNISFNRNKVLSLGNGTESYISGNYLVKVGEPLGSFYGAITDGILQTGEEKTKGVFTGSGTPKAGDRLYKDINNDGLFSSASDRAIIGHAQPDFIIGLNNTLSYKNFDLNFFFQASVGNKILNANRQALELFSGQQNAASSALDRWTPEHISTSIPRAKLDPAPVFSDRYVEDGSFVKLKSASLGYTFPKQIIHSLGISNLKIFISGTNLLTFTKYSGFDPEVTSLDNTVSQGYDKGIYPVSRTYNFGIIINF